MIYLIVEHGREEDDPSETYHLTLGYITDEDEAKAKVVRMSEARTRDDMRRGIWYSATPCDQLT